MFHKHWSKASGLQFTVSHVIQLSFPPPVAKGLSLRVTITKEQKEGKKSAGRKMEGSEGGRDEASKAGRDKRMNEG
jgi:hypothetical protein